MEGSKRIVEDILAEARKREREILESAEKETQTILQAAEISGREEGENLLKQGRKRAEEVYREGVMAGRLESRRHVLERRERLLREVFQEARKKLQEFTASKGYAEWMQERIEEAASVLGRELLIEAREEDLGLLDRLRPRLRERGVEIKVGSPIRCLGGFRASSPDRRMQLDQTLDGRLERLGEEARIKVARVLFS